MAGLKIIRNRKHSTKHQKGRRQSGSDNNHLIRRFLAGISQLLRSCFGRMTEARIIWSVMFLLACAMFILGLAVYPFYQEHVQQEGETSTALLELRLLDSGGHPVPGATVFFRNQASGQTDTFGEWKIVHQISGPENISLGIKRDSRKGSFDILKNLTLIPPEEQNENYEQGKIFRQKVILSLSSAQQLIEAQEKTTQPASSRLPVSNSSVRAEKQEQTRLERYQTIWFSVLPSQGVSRETMILKKFLLPALREEADRQGLKVDRKASFQVSLIHVPAVAELQQGFRGVIRVIARSREPSGTADFLRNYTGSSQLTARGLMASLRQHLPRNYAVMFQSGQEWQIQQPSERYWQLSAGDWLRNQGGQLFELIQNRHQRGQLVFFADARIPCGQGQKSCLLAKTSLPADPPSLSWRMVSRMIQGLSPQGSSVYFGGFKAISRGKDLWRFWARPGYSSYLSVIRDGRIIYRHLTDASDSPSTIARIPSEQHHVR